MMTDAEKDLGLALFVGVYSQRYKLTDFARVGAFARAHGFQTVILKFADGGHEWYRMPDFQAIVARTQAQGVRVLPYMYSYGDTFQALTLELSVLGIYMKQFGWVCADMEVQWNTHVDWAQKAERYLRPMPGKLYVSCMADPVQQAQVQVLEALEPAVDCWLPMVYTDELEGLYAAQWKARKKPVAPTVDLSNSFGANDPAGIARRAHQAGRLVSVWEYGYARSADATTKEITGLYARGNVEK